MVERQLVLPTYGDIVGTFFRAPGGPIEGAPQWEGRRALSWHEYCYDEHEPVYECWTREYVVALARYLTERARHYSLTTKAMHQGSVKEKTPRVLEVGAGTGKLALGLRQALAALPGGDAIVVDAVDNSARPMRRVAAGLVQEADYREALGARDYAIVICAWMPFGEDWTNDFRKKASVMEYILIGHTGDGLNGDPLRTWGYWKPAYDSPDTEGEHEEKEGEVIRHHDDDLDGDGDDEGEGSLEGYLPEGERAYVQEGFERIDLPHLSRWQLCRFDNVSPLSGQVLDPVVGDFLN